MMRIALVTNLYPPIQTGTAHWTRELARHLARANHHVVVITCASEGAAEYLENRGPVTVYRLPARRLAASRMLLGFDEFYLANTRRNRRRMSEIIAAHDIDVVHQCGHLLDLTYATPSVARRSGIPAVCSLHTVIHSPTSRVVDGVMKTIDRNLVRRFGPARYDALIALDAEVRAYAERTYEHERIRNVLVTVDDEILEQPPVVVDDAAPFRILSVGHVTAMRSRVDLVKAIDLLKRRGFAVQLEIIGKICDNRAVRLVRERSLDGVVTFTGELPRARVVERARTCHMEAHWITVPGLGSATLEAMALGLPAMAWAFPGLYDDVPLRDGIEFVRAEPGNIEQIAAQIQRLVERPDLRRAIGDAGREMVRRHLAWPTAIARLERIYTEVLEAVPSTGRVEAATV